METMAQHVLADPQRNGAPPGLDIGSDGLTEEEASAVFARVGPNEPVSVVQRTLLRQLLARFQNPLVLILCLASVISAILGDYVNASIVFLVVALSVALEFFQTRRSERAAEALKARVAHTALVRRSGHWKKIPRSFVVPGDVVRLAAGDMVPADATLLEGRDLHLNEAALTGESLPAEKEAGAELLMGSSVVSGTGRARVRKTGPDTAFGEIARALAARPPLTEFEHGIVRFGVFILKTVVFLVLFVFLVNAALHRDPLESLLFGVALAVGLTPEFLPMITTVTLTHGAEKMAKSSVIVKNLGAIQNLGSMDILCSDKTGTLTTGEMTLESHVGPFGETTERPLLFGYVNSYFESGVDDPVDAAVLKTAHVDPLDSAVLSHAHPDIAGFAKVDEVPFDFERRRVSVVVTRGAETLLVAKGAPEHVMEVCANYDVENSVRDFDDDARRRATQAFEAMCAKGYRVLAVAYAKLERRARYSKEDERNLTLAGFLAFADPPRSDACEVLTALGAAGVDVKVLTGDSEQVALRICERVGLSAERAVLGSDVDAMSDPALAHTAERTRLFARVSPAQKSRILRALRARGHVVGFLGDGVNDAPSLRAADVGLSVSSAVDVARDAADIILLEPGLKPLLAGIVEGRKAFGNVMKYLLMGTSSNFGNMLSMAGASALLPFLPMLPTQVLLNNFLYDVAQVAIPSDSVDDELVDRPRRWDIDELRRFMLWIGPVSSVYDFLTFYALLRLFHASERLFHTGWFVESLVTQALVIFVIRTARMPFASRPSRLLTGTVLSVVAIAIALPFTPFARALGFVALPAAFFPFLAVLTTTYLVLVEIVKRKILGHIAGGASRDAAAVEAR